MKYQLINENFSDNYIEQLVKTYGADAHHLLNPTVEDLEPPTNLDHIEEGAKLLDGVLKKNGKIVFVVDPDGDGFTASSILWLYIKRIYPDAQLHYLIHTAKQHGLSDLIDEIVEGSGAIDLVICPDSSSNDDEQHLILEECGVPVLVLDHHIQDAPTHSSAIIINNQTSPRYKNKELTGAGVVYQFCRFLDQMYGVNYADDYMDLASLGIIGDMGKVSEPENAYIIKKGLAQTPKNFLIQAFLDKQAYSIGDRMNSISIAFYVTPLINALIRVGTMEEKENLFCAFINGKQSVPSTKRGEKGLMECLATQVVRNCTNARVH